MIAGNELEILQVVETLMNARAQLDQVQVSGQSRFNVSEAGERVYITRGEFVAVLKSRVAEYERKAFELGVYGPGAKDTARAQSIAILHRNQTS